MALLARKDVLSYCKPRRLPIHAPSRPKVLRVLAQQPAAAAAAGAGVQQQSTPVVEPTASFWDGLFQKKQKTAARELVRKITAVELQELLQAQAGSTTPLIVIFSATWCGPCKVMDARLQSLAKRLGPTALQVVKIETDEAAEAELATRLRIHKLPTLMFCGPNKGPAVRSQGLMPEHVLRDLVENKCQRLGADLESSLIW